METGQVELQLKDIQRKLDAMQRELELRNRRLAELEELKDDLSAILKDVFQAAIIELDDVTPFLQTGDLTNLAKRLLRNTNRISDSISSLESAADFVADAQPISNDLFNRLILKLDELERKGYFRVGADAQQMADAVVAGLDRSQLLPAVGRSLTEVGSIPEEEIERYSLWKMYRASKQPEMQRLMGLFMTFLKTLAKELDTARQERN